ncbi:hypothetical protein ACJX0J_034749, partial [Zea mays]
FFSLFSYVRRSIWALVLATYILFYYRSSRFDLLSILIEGTITENMEDAHKANEFDELLDKYTKKTKLKLAKKGPIIKIVSKAQVLENDDAHLKILKQKGLTDDAQKIRQTIPKLEACAKSSKLLFHKFTLMALNGGVKHDRDLDNSLLMIQQVNILVQQVSNYNISGNQGFNNMVDVHIALRYWRTDRLDITSICTQLIHTILNWVHQLCA